MSKTHSIKEIKGNAVVFLKAASDNVSRVALSFQGSRAGRDSPPLPNHTARSTFSKHLLADVYLTYSKKTSPLCDIVSAF